jgi:PAS domain S-box-containing protein
MFIILSLISAILGMYILKRFRGLEAAMGILLICASVEWTLASLLQLGSVTISAKLFWNQVKYIGMVVLPLSWVLLTASYTGHEKWMNRRNIIFLSFIPVITIILTFTNGAHGLIWRSTTLDTEGPLVVLHHTYGTWFHLNILYMYVLLFSGSFLLIQMLTHYRSLFRWQVSALLVCALAPSLWSILYLFSFNLFTYLEPTPLLFPVANLAVVLALLYVRTVEIVPVARDAIIDSMSDSIIVLDAKNRIVDINTAAQNLMGRDSTIIGKAIDEIWPHWSSQKIFDSWTEGSTEIGLAYKSEQHTYDLRISTLTGWRGDLVSRVIVLRDITERKKAEDGVKASLREKEILLREVHHRVKNNLQVISSLLRLQSEHIKNEKEKELFKDSQNRIRSMSLIHEKLYQSKTLADIDVKEYVTDLVYGLFQSYNAPGTITLTVEVKDVFLSIDDAITCGLIINELVSNSLKHAFPGNRKGEIKTILRPANGDIELIVSDDGIGIPDDIDIRNTSSLGLHLVTILAEEQLNGKITSSKDNGTSMRITFHAGDT